MLEFLAARVYMGYMTAMKGKETPERPLVPRRWRKAVIKILLEMGMDANGDPINNPEASGAEAPTAMGEEVAE